MSANQRGQSDEDREKEAEKFKEAAEALSEGARKIGLYMQDAGVVMGPHDAFDEPTKVLVINFDIGEQAWSVRVQEGNESEQMARNLKQVEREMTQAQFDELRDRLARGEVFKSLDDEGEAE